jgi:hypothetical protein
VQHDCCEGTVHRDTGYLLGEAGGSNVRSPHTSTKPSANLPLKEKEIKKRKRNKKRNIKKKRIKRKIK